MRIFKKMFGIRIDDPDPVESPVEQAISKAIDRGVWPNCAFSKEWGKYVLHMKDDVIARIAISHSVVNDEEFRDRLSEAVKKASMEVAISNMGLKSVISVCEQAREKYYEE